jgi:hypothetical protein
VLLQIKVNDKSLSDYKTGKRLKQNRNRMDRIDRIKARTKKE